MNLTARFKRLLGVPLLFVAALSVATTCHAIPALQIYIEGATYDHDIESWIVNERDLTLWVVGNVSQKGPILDVRLAAAFMTGETGPISITGTSTSMLSDPSASVDPGSPYVSTDGEVPVMSDGSPLPRHGTYGAGVSFMQWSLGDFTLTDSQVGDFTGGFPTSFPQQGQINAYNVSISAGYSVVRFDVFNHVEGKTGALFGPFSHGGVSAPVPEPGTFALLGLGLVGFGFVSLRSRRRKNSK